MPRKARKIKPGPALVRISFLIDGDLASQVDRVAVEMTEEDPYKRTASRTDALKALIRAGLESRAK